MTKYWLGDGGVGRFLGGHQVRFKSLLTLIILAAKRKEMKGSLLVKRVGSIVVFVVSGVGWGNPILVGK